MDYRIRTLVQNRQDFLGKLKQEKMYHESKFREGLQGTSGESIDFLKQNVFREQV